MFTDPRRLEYVSGMNRIVLGEGLEMVPLDTACLEELHDLIDANREHLARFLPFARTQTPKQTREFLEKCLREREAGASYVFGLRLGGTLVGLCGVHDVDRENRSASLGYWLAEGHQGQGIVTRAVRALTDRLFRDFELNRVEIRAIPSNRRSRAVAERCGYTCEGVLREVAVFYEGFTDLVVYSLLRREWNGGTVTRG